MDPLVRINQAAPAVHLFDLAGNIVGMDTAIADLLLLNFWSAECPWSARADEILAKKQDEWGEAVEVWSIDSNANEEREQIRAAAEERRVRHVFIDPDQAAADSYGALTTPHFVLLDQERVVRYIGALDDTTFRERVPTRFFLVDAVEALRAGRMPEPQETPGYGCTILRYNL
jgi:thiol-disulfide isomerase/thioredoxin